MELNYPEYKKTGMSYQVTVIELVDFCHNKFLEYINLTQTIGDQPSKSPFSDPIIYTTKDGKLVQVPKEIQEHALNLFMKKTRESQENRENHDNQEIIQENHDNRDNHEIKLEIKQENNYEMFYLVLFSIIIFYLLVNNKK